MKQQTNKAKKNVKLSPKNKFLSKKLWVIIFIFITAGVLTLRLSFADTVNTYYYNSYGVGHHNGYGEWYNGGPYAWVTDQTATNYAWFGPYESLTISAPSGARLKGCFYFRYWISQQQIHMDIVAGSDHHALVSTSVPGSSIVRDGDHLGHYCITGQLGTGTTSNIEYRIKMDVSAGYITEIAYVSRTIM